MNRREVVVADTTPLNYLILIQQATILPCIFETVILPHAVRDELLHPNAPLAVSQWIRKLPEWAQITPTQQIDPTIQLGKGENEAISLALERQLNIVLIDERLGRTAAEKRGLIPVGTLNLIDLADERGITDGIKALHDLRQTTFRVGPELLERFEVRMMERRRK